MLKFAIILFGCLALSACGAAKAARDTGQLFDKYGCLAREFKGEPACKPDEA